MISIRVKYRPSGIDNHPGVIFYQIIYNRKVSHITTHYHIMPDEWDERHSTLSIIHGNERQAFLDSVKKCIGYDIERLNKISSRLNSESDNNGICFTSKDIINEFDSYIRTYTLCKYLDRLVADMKNMGRTRTAETYSATMRSFKMFLRHNYMKWSDKSDDIMLDRIDASVIEAYEGWLRNKSLRPNTISFYMRILRAVYLRAVDEGVIDNRHPFKRVYTGIERTAKRAIQINTIRKIKSIDLSYKHSLDFARDMFIMSLYLRGMSFVDMAFLKKSDLKDNVITYHRRKTGQLLTIAWTKEMQEILDKYPTNDSIYMMPIITKNGLNERCAYKNAGYKINRCLKEIARLTGTNQNLTMYVARHSWATLAKANGVPISVISEAMGHENEKTTQIYLASIETSLVDKANELIISLI